MDLRKPPYFPFFIWTFILLPMIIPIVMIYLHHPVKKICTVSNCQHCNIIFIRPHDAGADYIFDGFCDLTHLNRTTHYEHFQKMRIVDGPIMTSCPLDMLFPNSTTKCKQFYDRLGFGSGSNRIGGLFFVYIISGIGLYFISMITMITTFVFILRLGYPKEIYRYSNI